MTVSRPSRLALAALDLLVPDNEPLKGDLVEEFEVQRSQWWLWRQVIGAVLHKRPLLLRNHQPPWIPLVGAALLVLMSFEAVFAANVVYRLLFGPPPQDVTGYFYLFHTAPSSLPSGGMIAPEVWVYRVLGAFALSLPAGFWLALQLERRGRRLVFYPVAIGVALWAMVNLQLPFVAQFVSMLSLIFGLFGGGRLAVVAEGRRAGEQP